MSEGTTLTEANMCGIVAWLDHGHPPAEARQTVIRAAGRVTYMN